MNFNRSSAGFGLLTGLVVAFSPTVAQAFSFTRYDATPASVLDFKGLGYTYSSLYNPTTDATLRVRKNAADMTPTEISRFINALTTLKNTIEISPTGVPISIYDQFVATHLAMMDMRGRPGPNGTPLVDGGHNNAAFLPWHREYINQFELALQSVDSTVTLPYWDWTNRTATQNIIFQNNFMGPNGGVGGVGGGSVLSGYFTQANGWNVRDDLNANSWTGVRANPARPLTRNRRSFNELPTQTSVNEALAKNTYFDFRRALESGTGITARTGSTLHNWIHNWVRGSMSPMTSPNDPLFFLHHANVDRIWSQWQLNGHWGNAFYPSNGQPYGHNLNDRMFPWDNGQVTISNSLQGILPGLAWNQANSAPVMMAEVGRFGTPEELMSDNSGAYYNNMDGHDMYGGMPCDMHMDMHMDMDMPCEMMPCCDDLQSVPEPTTAVGILLFGAFGVRGALKRKQQRSA